MEEVPERKAYLAMTAEDHRAIGSTPFQILTDNPGKTWAETMNDEELALHVLKEVTSVTEVYEKAKNGDSREAQILKIIRDGYLVPNIAYLRSIGRLPAEFKDMDAAAKFAL
jgi:hypothetical protein